MKTYSRFTLFYITLTVSVLALSVIFRLHTASLAPPNTFNTYAMGNFDDYHQYMFIIKTGREGNLLYHNGYSEESIPDVLLQPFYTVAGYLSRPFPVDVYTVYFLLRLISLAVLFFSIYLLIIRMFTSTPARLLAAVLFSSATAVWTVDSLFPFSVTNYTLPYANFDIFLKYLVIPPHHNVAIGLLVFIFIILSTKSIRYSPYIAGLLAIVIGFIHPYILGLLLIFLGVNASYALVITKNSTPLIHFLKILLLTVPGILYYVYMYTKILRMDIAVKGILIPLSRDQSALSYIASLGPLFFISIPSLFLFTKTKSILFRFVVYWAFIPVLLFFLPDFNIPINTWRLFQIYQQIPLGILSAVSILWLLRRTKHLRAIVVFICLTSALYGGISLAHSYYSTVTDPVFIYTGRFVPTDVVKMFSYLNSNSPEHSVVIAGGVLSNILPSFSHNHTVIGHNGDNRNFLAKQKIISTFLSNKTPVNQVRPMLDGFNASYIIFGFDAPRFRDTPYASLPFLKEVYSPNNGSYSVVRIER